MKNPKEKGGGWERKVAKELSLWWSYKKSPRIFIRSASSGAWATIHKKEGVVAQVGDVAAADEEGAAFMRKVFIECKHWAKENSLLFEAILQKRSQILKWWQECEDRALDVRKQPWLVIKFNHKPPFVMFSKDFYDEMMDSLGMPKDLKCVLLIKTHFEESVFNTVMCMKFNEFLQWVKPESLR